MKPGGITHKIAFGEIRNFLAGRFLGATRDQALLEEVVKCLFVRSWLTRQDGLASISGADPLKLLKEYRKAFDSLQQALPTIFDQDEEILLDPSSLAFVDDRLSLAELAQTDSDPLGDAYQTFISSAVRGNEGQFFTPPAAVAWLVEAIAPIRGEKVIDPACGSGAFLSYASRYLIERGASPGEVARQIFGIEKDKYLSKLAAQHIALTTLSSPNINCADSLALTRTDGDPLDPHELLSKFDVVLANPPFGVKIVSGTDDQRSDFELAHKWTKHSDGQYHKADTLSSRTPPQILFLERILSLLKPGGRAGIVIPESTLSSPKYAYAVDYIRQRSEITAVIGMPESLFKTSGKGGTHTKTCLLTFSKKTPKAKGAKSIFMAEAQWCGHDSRGNQIPRDDLPKILNEFLNKDSLHPSKENSFGYLISEDKLEANILAPRYYQSKITHDLSVLSTTHDLISFGQLLEDGVISYTTGVEVGKLAYGGGDIPFIRTSDISNWEIKIDPKHSVSQELYNQLAPKLDVRSGDILMVKDGTYLIGSCALITNYDEKIVYQSHLYKIRVKKPEMISPHLLLAVLSSDIVQQQIKSKKLSQDIIDSLGSRIKELVLPLPKSQSQRTKIEQLVKKVIDDRIEARELSRQVRQLVMGANQL